MAKEPTSLRAERRWRSIPADVKQQILACVWCTNCRSGQPIKDWKLCENDDAVLIEGRCAVCGGECVRLLEEE